jgi:error-prone DNA polymerase
MDAATNSTTAVPAFDPRSLPPNGLRTRDIYIPDLHIDSIKVKTRNFR